MSHPAEIVIQGPQESTAEGTMDDRGLQAAESFAKEEKAMTLRETIKVYRKAIMWSLVVSMAIIMEGYDVIIINSFFGHTEFLRKFGTYDEAAGKYYVPANWQSALNNAASIGQVLGLLVNGYCSPKFGYRRTYMGGMVAMAAAIFIVFFSQSIPMLFAGELACGIPWGLFQTLTTAYAADICPIALRGYLTSWGLTAGSAVVRASLSIEGEWGYRLPWILQWIWPLPLFLAILFAPESPWWLVKNQRDAEAAQALRKLSHKSFCTDERIEAQIMLMKHTYALEKQEEVHTSWKELFRGTNRRRTEVVCVVWACQYWCGQPLSNFATQFLQSAGMDQAGAFNLNIANTLMIFVGTVISWMAFYRFGRRTLYIWGLCAMALLFLVMGVIGSIPATSSTAIGIGVSMILITLVFGVSVAPVCYTIVVEVPAASVRQQSVVLARICYVVSQLVLLQFFPRFLTPRPDGWELGGKAGYIFVAVNLGLATYCYFRLPETIGRTFGEIDVLFHNKIKACAFKRTVVDEFQADRRVENYDNGAKEKDAASITQVERA